MLGGGGGGGRERGGERERERQREREREFVRVMDLCSKGNNYISAVCTSEYAVNAPVQNANSYFHKQAPFSCSKK